MEAERAQSNGHLVDVNSASSQVISKGINGIGPVLAQRIVNRRLANGPFAALEQLVEIDGIGEKLLQRIAGQITLGSGPSIAVESPLGLSVPLDETLEDAMAEDTIQETVASEEQDNDVLQDQPLGKQPDKEPEALAYVEPNGAKEVSETPPTDEPEEANATSETPPAEEPEETNTTSETPPAEEPTETESISEVSAADEEEPLEPEETAAGISAAASGELEQEIEATAGGISELGLYTRTTAEADLSEWAPAPVPALSDDEEEALASLEPDEPDWLLDQDEDLEPETAPAELVKAEAAPLAQTLSEQALDELPQPEPSEPATPAWDEPLAAAVPAQAAQQASTAPTPPKTEASAKREGMGFWRSLWLVLLGGLLGVLLTLAIAIIWTGTLDFASKPQVDALSRNVGTMQANQEMAWQRIDELTVGSQELTRKVAQLEQLRDTVNEMQTSLQQAEEELANTQASLDVLGEDVVQLRESTDAAISQLDERVGGNEEAVADLDATLTELEDAFATVEQRVGTFDGFFSSLRDLLINMQGMPEMAEPIDEIDAAEEVAPTEEVAPIKEVAPTEAEPKAVEPVEAESTESTTP